MDSENKKEELYTDILHCVLDVLVKLDCFIATATEEELSKWSDLVDVRSRLYCTIAQGRELAAKEKEEQRFVVVKYYMI